jgi:hypothetical protein
MNAVQTDWRGLKFLIVLCITGWLLTACREAPDEVVTVNTPQATTAVPTATQTPLPPTVTTTATSLPGPITLTPFPTSTARPTRITPTPSNTPTAAPTRVPLEEILTQFPLYIGQVRVYRVTYTYATDPNDESQPTATWTGLITETITAQHEAVVGLVYEAAVQGMPTDLEGETVVLQDGTIEYVVDHNGIRRGAMKVIQFPLEIDASWNIYNEEAASDGDPPWYAWLVVGQRDVALPAGFFNNCWDMTLQTETEDSNMTFCPGTGIVSWVTTQRGGTDTQSWLLYWMGET